MKYCTNCGEKLEDKALFCSQCGTKQIPQKPKCGSCGAEYSEGQKFCMECGSPLGKDSIKKEDKEKSKEFFEKEAKRQSEEGTKRVQKIEEEIDETRDEVDQDDFVSDLIFDKLRNKGGIIVYDETEEGYEDFVTGLMCMLDPEFGEEIEKIDSIAGKLNDLLDEDGIDFHTFGEPGRDVSTYGEPEDDYDGNIKYGIVDDEILLLIGEGDTFRILSDKDQKASEENFWVLNSEIKKLRNKIKTVFVYGEDTSIRARIFKNFKNLERVYLSDEVEGIRKEAFYNCPLKLIAMPKHLKHIVEDSFKDAEFKILYIPKLESDPDDWEFQEDAFVDCKELKYAFFPNNLNEACDLPRMFKGCDNLWHNMIWRLDLMSEENKFSTEKPAPDPIAEKYLKDGKSLLYTSYDEAMELFDKAVERDYLPALLYLGDAYMDGTPLNSDWEKGSKLLKKAAEIGGPEMQYHFALKMKEIGYPEVALDWFNVAAKRGHTEAQLMVGLSLFNYIDEMELDSEAEDFYEQPVVKELLKWISLAAEKNNPTALFTLAQLNMAENFPGHSVASAKKLAKKALEYGCEDAKEFLDELD